MSWENFCDSAAEEDGQVVITDATGRVFYGKSRNATISFEDVAALAGELSAPTFPFRFRGEEMMSRERRHNLFVATKPYTMFVVVDQIVAFPNQSSISLSKCKTAVTDAS
eukprot:TRINITY_DN2640_c0_g1_i2.p2 TRINITY_DN2640_c0_g1~~TRINITY_DN2640_c0_g1_i2.p2  ORF type:complete len:110 (-),score=10.91 TRINITY_DN2640_c0_g1_i2:32-361(-)